jgi:hypothetical protein
VVLNPTPIAQKGKPCAYCTTAIANSVEHVFARQFFPPGDHEDLPKAPACIKCNGENSKLDWFFQGVMS